MTAVDRPDNGQDEGPCYCWQGVSSHTYAADCPSHGHLAVLAPSRAGAGEQQRDELLHEVECPSCGATIRARMADAPQPDGEAEPCPVYSHGADGWHCAVTGDHDQHTNAAGDVTW